MNVSYKQDFYLWSQQQAQLLAEQAWEQLDLGNLKAEIEEMGRREKRSVESNLVVLLLHLLKWQYQPAHRSSSWRGTIKEHRRRLRKDLQDSLSLRPHANEQLSECYDSARTLASGDTGLEEAVFPQHCPYSLEQLLSPEYLP
jgi:hypothetical protein